MLEAIFDREQKEVTVAGLTQWDKGRKLKIVLSDMPDNFEVHFAMECRNIAEVVEAETVAGQAVVDIPNMILRNHYNTTAYIYYTDGDTGKTVKSIHLPITPRARPADYLYEEYDVLSYTKILNLLNSIKKGEDGKNAYEYARDGGFEGTESEFSEKLNFLMGIADGNEVTY